MTGTHFLAEVARLVFKRWHVALLFLALISWWILNDYVLVAGCCFVGIWYVSLTMKQGPISTFVEWMCSKIIPENLQKLEGEAIFSFLLVSIGILALFLLRAERISILGRYVETRSEKLEIAAALGDVILSALYYAYLLEDKKSKRKGFLFILPLAWLAIGAVLTYKALVALGEHDPGLHLHMVCWLAVSNLLAGVLIAFIADRHRRRSIFEAALYAELPTVAAFAFIILFIRNLSGADSFLSGAIAFQFIASSVLLLLIESGMLDVFLGSRDGRSPSVAANALCEAAPALETRLSAPLLANSISAESAHNREAVSAARFTRDSVNLDEAEQDLFTVYEIAVGDGAAMVEFTATEPVVAESVGEEARSSTETGIYGAEAPKAHHASAGWGGSSEPAEGQGE